MVSDGLVWNITPTKAHIGPEMPRPPLSSSMELSQPFRSIKWGLRCNDLFMNEIGGGALINYVNPFF